MTIRVDDNHEEVITKESLKDEIGTALTMCNQLDEPHKTIFTTILKALQYRTLEKQPSVPKVEDREFDIGEAPEYIQKLCKVTQIEANDLEYLFNFKDESLELATISGGTWKEKQINASLCILTANHYCFESGEISSSDLAKQLRKIKIGSMDNLSKNLANYIHFIDMEEVHKTKKIYKIKGPGRIEGLKIIKEQVSNQKGECDE